MAVPPTICPTAKPNLASGVPWGSTSPASASCCPTPPIGTSPSETPARNPPSIWTYGFCLQSSGAVVAACGSWGAGEVFPPAYPTLSGVVFRIRL
jgi:hypothetical protein